MVDFQYDFWDDDENENFSTQNTFPILEEEISSRTETLKAVKTTYYR